MKTLWVALFFLGFPLLSYGEQRYFQFYRLQGDASSMINLNEIRLFSPVSFARTSYNFYGTLRFRTNDGKVHIFQFANPQVPVTHSNAFSNWARSPFALSVVCKGEPERTNSNTTSYKIVGSGVMQQFGNDPELKENGDCKFYEISSMN